jgi:hypothetical protein
MAAMRAVLRAGGGGSTGTATAGGAWGAESGVAVCGACGAGLTDAGVVSGGDEGVAVSCDAGVAEVSLAAGASSLDGFVSGIDEVSIGLATAGVSAVAGTVSLTPAGAAATFASPSARVFGVSAAGSTTGATRSAVGSESWASAGSAAASAIVESRHKAARRMAEGLSGVSGFRAGTANGLTPISPHHSAFGSMTASAWRRKRNPFIPIDCAISLADLPRLGDSLFHGLTDM